jgi:hypothetical protein
VPQQTIEGAEVDVSAPPSTAGVGGPGARAQARVEPNPGRSGRELRLSLGADAGEQAHIFDLAGREVAQVALHAAGAGWEGIWEARDARGSALPPGVYLVRGRTGRAFRLVLLDP